MISLILPPKSDIAKTNQMLQLEYGTASNIKSRVNRQSVLAAITSAQQVRRGRAGGDVWSTGASLPCALWRARGSGDAVPLPFLVPSV